MVPDVDGNSRTADGAAITAWIGWVFSHLATTNLVLQFVVLVIALISGLYALVYHRYRLNAITRHDHR